MSILFNGIPREVRDKIYQLLLVKDREEAIKFIEWNNEHGYGRVSGLHPAILRTCKQAYAEGISVLYEKNVFSYKSCVGKGRSIDIADPLKGKFSKIKHFKFIHFVDAPGIDDTPETYLRSVNSSPSTAMRFLATAGCLLKTLNIEIRLFATPGKDLSHQARSMIGCLACDANLIRIIAAVAVGRRITLTAGGYMKDKSDSYEYMVKAVEVIKQWTIVEDVSETRKGTWDIFVRTWVLKPATAATVGKVTFPEI